MPVRAFRVWETHTRVLDPIAEQIAFSLLRQLGIERYFNDQGQVFVHTDRTAISRNTEEGGYVRVSNDRADFQVEYIFNPLNTQWSMDVFDNMQAHWMSLQRKNEHVPLFSDPVADVQVVESHVPTGINMEVTLAFNTIDGAMAAVEAINNIQHGTAITTVHDIVYTYPLDTYITNALFIIYKHRTFTPPKNFITYLIENSTAKIQLDARREDLGKDPKDRVMQLVVKRHQLGGLAVLQYTESAPEAEKIEQQTDRFLVKFQYMFQFSRPGNLRMTYPVMVENKLLPSEMVYEEPSSYIESLSGVYLQRSFNSFLRTWTPNNPPITCIRVPYYDDFNVPYSPVRAAQFNHFFLGGLILGSPTEAIVVDLSGDLGDGLRLHPKTVEIMKMQAADRSILKTNGIYNVSVFVNDTPLSTADISVTPDLVFTIDVRDMQKRYHLVISEATDVRQLDNKYLQVLMDNRCYFPSTVASNLQALIKRGVYKIVPSSPLLSLVRNCLYRGTIDPLIRKLIDDGHCEHDVWEYTQSADQIIHYTSITKSAVSTCYLFEELVKNAVAAGCIAASQVPSRFIEPVIDQTGVTQGSYYGWPNTPLRIIDANITVAK